MKVYHWSNERYGARTSLYGFKGEFGRTFKKFKSAYKIRKLFLNMFR